MGLGAPAPLPLCREEGLRLLISTCGRRLGSLRPVLEERLSIDRQRRSSRVDLVHHEVVHIGDE